MRRLKGHGCVEILLGLAMLAVGCGQGTPTSSEVPKSNPPSGPSAAASPPAIPAAATPAGPPASDRPANPNGKVFVLMYHHLGESKSVWFRTPDQFRGDLERLDKMGFRPETVTEYLDGSKQLPKGATPAVFTFDDANADQVKLNADGTLAKDCFLGIWQEYAASHPEFPIKATFFVLPDVMWGQPSMVSAKIALLNKLGCELGNHSMTHPSLKTLSDDKVKWEIGEAQDRLEKFGVPMPCSLALPFGISPKNKSLLEGFDYNGKHVAPKAVFLVGANPAPSPSDPKFNRLRIPRIRASEGDLCLTYWLDQVEKGRVKLFVTG